MLPDVDPFAADPFGNTVPLATEAADLDSVREHVSEYRRLKGEIARLEKMAAIHREAIEKVMGERAAGSLDGQPVLTYGYQARESLDTKRLQRERPDIWNAFTEVRSIRYFRIK